MAEGDRQAIDRIQVENAGDQLNISIDRTNWTGDTTSQNGARGTLYVTTPDLASLSVIGAGNVTVDRVRGASFTLILTGSGSVAVQDVRVDQLTVGVNGAGNAKLAGQAKQARIRSQGEANVDAAALSADDTDVALIGAGQIGLAAVRSARNILKGSGSITISGNPACTGTSEGSGEVLCGR